MNKYYVAIGVTLVALILTCGGCILTWGLLVLDLIGYLGG